MIQSRTVSMSASSTTFKNSLKSLSNLSQSLLCLCKFFAVAFFMTKVTSLYQRLLHVKRSQYYSKVPSLLARTTRESSQTRAIFLLHSITSFLRFSQNQKRRRKKVEIQRSRYDALSAALQYQLFTGYEKHKIHVSKGQKNSEGKKIFIQFSQCHIPISTNIKE